MLHVARRRHDELRRMICARVERLQVVHLQRGHGIPRAEDRVAVGVIAPHPPGQGLTGDEAIMAAFEENARDTSRVGGT